MQFDTSMLNTLMDLVGGMLAALAAIMGGWAVAVLAMNLIGERDGAAMKNALNWAAAAGLLGALGGFFIAMF
ncbi:MAG: hypothetical protein Q4D96_03580 [Propionibacteriaceae bacterium]|nr:hypothetical protein [Propionibacteriaceae bacterium]